MPDTHPHNHRQDTSVKKLSVAEALNRIKILDVDPETINQPVTESKGCVLAEDVVVKDDLPLFDQSAMDGYAVRSRELSNATEENPVELFCKTEVTAGQSEDVHLSDGEAFRIYTGAPIPPGADAVVIQEKVEREDGTVRFFEPAEPGDNIRKQGEEVQSGTVLKEAGTVVNNGGLGLILSQGYETVETFRRPTTAVVSTGDELVDYTEDPGPGEIRDTNSPMIFNLLENYTDEISVHRVADQRNTVKETFRTLLDQNDLLFVSGGVSVGDRDYVRPVLNELGVRKIFWKVNQKPGKPLYLGEKDGTKIMGLPGNPVSAMVCLSVYGIPLVRKLSGFPEGSIELHRGYTRLDEPYENSKPRTEFVRARTRLTKSGYRSGLLEHQGSHMLTGLARANSLVVLPPQKKTFTPEENLPCYFLPDVPIMDNGIF